jgi:hypothetical protein
MEAVSQDGLALQFASLRSDPDILRAAVTENSVASEYVPNSIRQFKFFREPIRQLQIVGLVAFLIHRWSVQQRDNMVIGWKPR